MAQHSTAKHQDVATALARAEARLRHWREVYRFWVRDHDETLDQESYAYATAAWVAIDRLEKIINGMKHRNEVRDYEFRESMKAARPVKT